MDGQTLMIMLMMVLMMQITMMLTSMVTLYRHDDAITMAMMMWTG